MHRGDARNLSSRRDMAHDSTAKITNPPAFSAITSNMKIDDVRARTREMVRRAEERRQRSLALIKQAKKLCDQAEQQLVKTQSQPASRTKKAHARGRAG